MVLALFPGLFSFLKEVFRFLLARRPKADRALSLTGPPKASRPCRVTIPRAIPPQIRRAASLCVETAPGETGPPNVLTDDKRPRGAVAAQTSPPSSPALSGLRFTSTRTNRIRFWRRLFRLGLRPPAFLRFTPKTKRRRGILSKRKKEREASWRSWLSPRRFFQRYIVGLSRTK